MFVMFYVLCVCLCLCFCVFSICSMFLFYICDVVCDVFVMLCYVPFVFGCGLSFSFFVLLFLMCLSVL